MKRTLPFHMKWGDILIASIIIILAVWFSACSLAGRSEAVIVEIYSEDELSVYPLNENRRLDFEGPVGNTHVIIRDGEVSVEHSDCVEKICVNQKPIESSYQWIACLPNELFITMKGGEDDEELDAEVR